jgi:hypothetical protein
LGSFSGWHKDFSGDQATTLNRMVMLYALPLLLFRSTLSILDGGAVASSDIDHRASNDEYCILKSFAVFEETPGVPGLDIPGLDIGSISKGYGCDAARLDDLEEIQKAAVEAWNIIQADRAGDSDISASTAFDLTAIRRAHEPSEDA